MTNYVDMKKDNLLALATQRKIRGRHDMSKYQLASALASYDVMMEPSDEELVDADTVREVKRKVKSPRERDEEGRVIRKGRNLSGNTPYRRKYYYLPLRFADESMWSESYKEAVTAAPNQVRLILKTMRKHNMVDGFSAARGAEIVQRGINDGIISTVCDPAELFAYYRRTLEVLGVTLHEDGDNGDKE